MKKWIINILMLLFVVWMTGCSSQKEYVATIDGDKVSVQEFNIYLYEVQKNYESLGGKDIWDTDFDGKTAQEAAKEAALNSIAQIKITAKQAKQMNIVLSKEEKEQALKDAQDSINAMDAQNLKKIAINQKELADIMQQKALRNKVFSEVTKNFELSEKDFELYYLDYIEQHRQELLSLDVQYVFLKSGQSDVLEKANKVLQLAKSGEDFGKLVQEYSEDTESIASNGEINLSKGEREEVFENAAFSLEVNEVSDLVKTENGYYIIKLKDIIEPNSQQLKDKIKQYYIANKKQQLFEQEYEKWQNDKKIEKNIDVWNNIKIEV